MSSTPLKETILVYPVILTECQDEHGHYYGVTSPNIPGMVTDGKAVSEAVVHALDAIATMLCDQPDYPTVQDPTKWQLDNHDSISQYD